jgi:hypothetical protein
MLLNKQKSRSSKIRFALLSNLPFLPLFDSFSGILRKMSSKDYFLINKKRLENRSSEKRTKAIRTLFDILYY